MEPWKPLPLFLPTGNISIRQVFACMVRRGRPEFGIGFLFGSKKCGGILSGTSSKSMTLKNGDIQYMRSYATTSRT